MDERTDGRTRKDWQEARVHARERKLSSAYQIAATVLSIPRMNRKYEASNQQTPRQNKHQTQQTTARKQLCAVRCIIKLKAGSLCWEAQGDRCKP